MSNGKAFPLDVTNSNSIGDFFKEIVKEMGPADALVTAAGIDNGQRSVAELDHEFVMSTMDVNVVGLILCCQEFAKQAIDTGRPGIIVNLSSMAATIGGRMHKTVYAASKGAVDVFTVGAAKELAPHGISVFSVRPGVTRTDMTEKALADSKTKLKNGDLIQKNCNLFFPTCFSAFGRIHCNTHILRRGHNPTNLYRTHPWNIGYCNLFR